jgi:LDH2 family malate/lactate/ureidoglycolate dehydrogenase
LRLGKEPLRRLVIAVFEAAGVSNVEAQIVSEILVDASLHGVDSHGVRNMPMYIRSIKGGRLKPGATITTLRETETTAMLDDGAGFGYVAAKKAMGMAIAKAKKHKIGSVGVQGPGHIGPLYYYSLMAVKEDLIGITLCRGGGHGVAPYGGVEGRLGVNPLCIGIPAGEEKPIILDMATTGAAIGRLGVMAARGQKVPEGWLIRKDGTWATDFDSSMFRSHDVSPVCFGYPHSEYKGYGLSVVVEALAGGIGIGCSLDAKGYGHLFTAIDPEGYCSIDEFKARIDSMTRHMKSSARRPGFEQILLPWGPEWIEKEKRSKEGIFVDDPFWENILATAKELGVDAETIIREER